MKKLFKKGIVICLCVIVVSLMIFSLVGCGLKNFTPTTRFIYSKDGGNTWSETLQEVPINKTYWLGVEVQIQRATGLLVNKEVGVEVTIPGTDILDAYLDDHPGTSVTGITNSDGSKTYPFTLLAGTNPQTYRIIFECIPLQEGRATIYVTFDDKVDSTYDKTGIIRYVAEEE